MPPNATEAKRARPGRNAPPQPQFHPGHRAEILEGSAMLPRLLDDIRAARQCILAEFYIFRDDKTGRAILEALRERAQAGVTVRLLRDGLGSWRETIHDKAQLVADGVDIRTFNPLWGTSNHFNNSRLHRDHRKVVVVDGSAAWMCSGNIGDEYVVPTHPAAHWDLYVRFSGPLCTRLAETFHDSWTASGAADEPIACVPPPPPAEPLTEAALMISDGRAQARHFTRTYARLFREARQRIWIANPYFVPRPAIRQALVKAARRGLDVRLYMPYDTDWQPVRQAMHYLYPGYHQSGIRVFEWQPARLHAKAAVIDDLYSSVGSFNFDSLSTNYNQEANILFRDTAMNARLATLFETVEQQSKEITKEHFLNRSHLKRLREAFWYEFREWF